MESARPIPRAALLRFGVGQIGAQLFRDTPAALLPVFMTTILGVPAWLAGVTVLVPKLWVIFCDPLMGAWSDRCKPAIGRAPFLLVGAITTAAGFLSLFWFSGYDSPLSAAVLIGLLFVVSSTGFSAFMVPYFALVSEMADDPHERTRILAYRMYFAILGVQLGVGVAQPLVQRLGGGAAAWRSMAELLAAICLLSMLTTALGVRRNARTAALGTEAGDGFLARVRGALGPGPFRTLTGVWFVVSVSQAACYSAVGFMYIYAVGRVELLLPFVVSMSLGGLLSQGFWIAWSRRVGKERAFVISSLAWTVVTITWFFVHPDTRVLFSVPGYGGVAPEHLLVLVRGVLLGVSNSGFVVLAQSMLTDTIEYDRRRRGAVDEGLYSGLFIAVEKLSFAVGPLIAGLVMSLTGFRSSTTGIVPQEASAVFGIVLLYSLIPAAIQLLALLLFRRYRCDLVTLGLQR